MSRTMFLDLEERLARADFDRIASNLGIVYSPRTIGGNTYYFTQGEERIELQFGGVEQQAENTAYATQLSVSSCPKDLYASYEAMKEVVLRLGEHVQIATISGDFIDQIYGEDGVIYTPVVFELLDQQWDRIEAQEREACDTLKRFADGLPDKPIE